MVSEGSRPDFGVKAAWRWNLPPSQAVAVAKVITPIQQKAAAERTKAAGRVGGTSKGSEKFSDPTAGRSADKVAAAVGMSAPTLAKATAVVKTVNFTDLKIGKPNAHARGAGLTVSGHSERI